MPKAKPITYTATYNGKIVGQRKSPRPYTHAVIVQHDEEASRAYAYNYTATALDKKDFNYYTECAGRTAGAPITYIGGDGKPWVYERGSSQDEIDRDAKRIEGGFEAYIERKRARLIEGFEASKAKGAYEPQVAGWSMSRRNVEKMAQACTSKVLAIVDAVAK